MQFAFGRGPLMVIALSGSAALLTGPLIQWSGLPAAGLVAVLVSVPPLLMWLTIRIKERSVRRAATAVLPETP